VSVYDVIELNYTSTGELCRDSADLKPTANYGVQCNPPPVAQRYERCIVAVVVVLLLLCVLFFSFAIRIS
jgi:hypothetical protein